jgi:hypothetical protein
LRAEFVVTLCAQCENPIPARARRDAVCCSVRCRQARHRFLRAVGYPGSVAPARRFRLAYADRPYRGNAFLYRDHPDYAGEIDYAELIRRLQLDYEGWALSTSAAALPAVLALCPPRIQVAAWHKGERTTRSGYPLDAWEPVICHGGRQLPGERRADSIVRVVTPVPIMAAAGLLAPCRVRLAVACSPAAAVGHSDIEVTMTIYAHVSLAEQRKALRAKPTASGVIRTDPLTAMGPGTCPPPQPRRR